MNILNAPTRTIPERREILQRVYTALVLDPQCHITLVTGRYQDLTEDQTANWEARQTIVGLMKEVQR